MVRLLLAAGADPNVGTPAYRALRQPPGMEPLLAAVYYGYVEIVDALIDAGAVCRDRDGVHAALEYALWCRHLHVVKLLLHNERTAPTWSETWGALLAEGGILLHAQGPCYDTAAQLLLHSFKLPTWAQPVDVFLAQLSTILQQPPYVHRVDKVALGFALIRGWGDETAKVTAGRDAATTLERGAAAAKVDVLQLLVQVGMGNKVGCGAFMG